MWQLIQKFMNGKWGMFAGLIAFLIVLFAVKIMVFRWTPWTWWIIAAVVITIIWILILWIQHRREQQQSGTLKAELRKGADKDASSARPDRQSAYIKSKENFEYAIELLERSRPKGFSGNALYRLPWVLVVGPPADGKSTAILNSGIRFPHDPRMDEAGGSRSSSTRKIEGTGGTKSCNWFFSTDGIILDTAGRFMARETGEVDEPEWLSFLQMLQKFRPKRPINGVVALCSIERVLTSRASAQEWAQKIRRQINDVMGKLQTHVPVYLIFNKCDLVHGFVEYFGDLDQESRRQIWGFTREYKPKLRKSGVGVESEHEAIVDDLDRELGSLVRTLEERRMHRLADPELFAAQRAALCIFPGEFSAIIEPLKEFISDIFYDTPYGNNPILRGVYFTSATQYEGNPIVKLMQEVAGEYDIPLDALPFTSRMEINPYFLHDLFHDVVFKDEHLGGRFKKSAFDRTRKILVGCVAATTLLMSVWMTASYFVGSSKNNDLSNRVKQIKSTKLASLNPDRAVYMLDSLRVTYDDYTSTGAFGLFYWLFGRDENGKLGAATDSLLAAQVEQVLITNAWQQAQQTLYAGGRAFANLGDYVNSYKTYHYLAGSSNDNRGRQDTLVTYYVMQKSRIGRTSDTSGTGRMREMVAQLLTYYNESTRKAVRTADLNLVQRAQKQIHDAWDWTKFLKDLVDQESEAKQPFSPNDFNFSQSTTVSVRPAYLVSTWNGGFKDKVEATYAAIQGDEILRGILGDRLNAPSGNPLVDAYFAECREEWRQFFQRLAADFEFTRKMIKEPKNLEKLLNTAAAETGFSNPGMVSEFGPLHDFTGIQPQLGIGEAALGEAVGKNEKPPEPAIGKYLKLLEDISTKVEAPASNCAKWYQQVGQSMGSKVAEVRTLVPQSTYLRDLLCESITGGSGLAAAAKTCLNDMWASQVVPKFLELRSFYPFSASNLQDAMFDDVKKFFSSDGAFKAFDLAEGQPAREAGLLPSSYGRLQELSRKIYLQLGGSRAGFVLEMSVDAVPQEMQQLSLSTGQGIIKQYSQGPKQDWDIALPWVNDKLELNMTLGRGAGFLQPLSFKGEWAPLRMLDQAQMIGGRGKLVFTESSNGKQYDLILQMSQPGGESLSQLLRQFESSFQDVVAP